MAQDHRASDIDVLLKDFFGTPGQREKCPPRLLRDMAERLQFRLAWFYSKRERIHIPEGLAAAHEIAVRRNRRRLQKTIGDALGKLAQQYRAQHAWVYVSVGRSFWRAMFSFRKRLKNQTISSHARCIISHVIQSRAAYVASDTTHDPIYKSDNPTTRSQIAAPVLVHVQDEPERVIGVVSFESDVAGAFVKEQEQELANDAQEFAVPLLCLEAISSGDFTKWPFNPDRHGWDGDRILKYVCDEFTRVTGSRFSKADLATTVWHVDWECKHLWARATAGYNYDYLRNFKPFESFSGDCVQSPPPGEVSRVDSGESSFFDIVEARPMGLTRAMSCPVFDPRSGFTAIGAVNIYQFGNEARDRLPGDVVVQQFAKMVGHVMVNVETLRRSLVSTHLAWQMERSARLADEKEVVAAQFHVLKDALHEYFGANGCSIYVPDAGGAQLTVAATTGTRGRSFRYHEGRWVFCTTLLSAYDLNEKGVMQYLYHHPAKALVLNDITQLAQVRGAIDPELPEAIIAGGMEHLTPDTTARRFLGIGIRLRGRKFMVVRLTRSMDHAPFTNFDARLLESLAILCQHNEFWIPPSQESSCREQTSSSGLPPGCPFAEQAKKKYEPPVYDSTDYFNADAQVVS